MRPGRWRGLLVMLALLFSGELIAAFAIPQGPSDSWAVTAWIWEHPALGRIASQMDLHALWGSWHIYAIAAVLALGLVVAAVRRTSDAVTLLRGRRALTGPEIERLRTESSFSFLIPAGAAGTAGLAAAAGELESLGLSVRSGPRIAEGRSGTWGSVGYPIMYWALGVAVVFVAVGGATRFQGEIALPLGDVVNDVEPAYTWTAAGPLAPERGSGLSFLARELVHLLPGSSDPDTAVFVTLRRGDQTVRAEWLRHAWVPEFERPTLRQSGIGRSAIVSLEATGGAQISRTPVILEPGDESSTTMGPGVVSLTDESGRIALKVRVSMTLEGESQVGTATVVPGTYRATVATAIPEADTYSDETTLDLGEALALTGGQYLRFVSADEWVRVSVVDDWSLPWILASLGIAGLGLALARLVPRRRVQLLLLESDTDINVVIESSLRESAVRERVREALQQAVAGTPACESEEQTGEPCA